MPISPLHLGVCPGEAGSVPVLSGHEQEKEAGPCSVQLAAKPRPHMSCRQHIVSSGSNMKRDTATPSWDLDSWSMRSGYIKCVELKCEIHVWQVWNHRSGIWSWDPSATNTIYKTSSIRFKYAKHDLQKPQAWDSSTSSMIYKTSSIRFKYLSDTQVHQAWDPSTSRVIQEPQAWDSKYINNEIQVLQASGPSISSMRSKHLRSNRHIFSKHWFKVLYPFAIKGYLILGRNFQNCWNLLTWNFISGWKY